MMPEPATDEGFAKHWRRIGPLLEEIRRSELAAFDHKANWHLIDGLLEFAYQHRTERKTSGLVELQRKLHGGKRS
jgi:hypothetical protein